MKKIIIVNNNLKVGGVQKSLYNLLWSIDTKHEYDVTLLLFEKVGAYIDKLPESVKILSSEGPFRYLGKNQSEYRNSLKDTVCRGFFAAVSRIFGRKQAIRLMLLKEPVIDGHYDCAVAFLHNGRKIAYYGGVQDFVLGCINADKKVAFLHCDYLQCGAYYAANNRQIEQFHKIAACSDGCRNAFTAVLPALKDKCVTVRNCHRYDEIQSMANEKPLVYDDTSVNIIMVTRLSHEKGIDRAIRAVAAAAAKEFKVKLHIVGSGTMQTELQDLAQKTGIGNDVIFYGEQSNPYRYMKNADLLLMTSYHEAAPMVIDEARALALPVLTTETTSSGQMVTDMTCGWVCENTQEGISAKLCEVVSDRETLAALKKTLAEKTVDNIEAVKQFAALIEN